MKIEENIQISKKKAKEEQLKKVEAYEEKKKREKLEKEKENLEKKKKSEQLESTKKQVKKEEEPSNNEDDALALDVTQTIDRQQIVDSQWDDMLKKM